MTTMQLPSAPIVWAGRVGMAISLISILLLFAKDPFHLVLPSALIGVVLGLAAVRRGGEQQAAAHIAINVGVMTLLLWVVVIAFM